LETEQTKEEVIKYGNMVHKDPFKGLFVTVLKMVSFNQNTDIVFNTKY